MTRLHELWSRFRTTLRRRDTDAEMAQELQFHLEQRIERNRAAGMLPDAARQSAVRAFGGVEQIKERARDVQRWRWLEDFFQDARVAMRQLRKAPTFSVVAIASLAIGIGANTVALGVLNSVVLQPLGVREPDNLYQLRAGARASGRMLTTSYPAFEDLRSRNTTFSGMAAFYGYSNPVLSWRATVTKVRGFAVTGNYFDLLGVEPQVGRFFHAVEEHGPGSMPYVILSDSLWRKLFNADPAVVGTIVELNQHPFTVLGVASARFHGTERFEWPDYWIPLVNEDQVEGGDILRNRASSAVTVIGRLKPGATPQRATDELNRLAIDLAKEHPMTDRGVSLRLIHPGLFADDGDVIRGFICGVTVLALLVWVAACANLASLFAARASDRGRELALRVALGSTRLRLVRQLLTEALVIAVIGGIAGVVSAALLLGALNRWQPPLSYGGQRLAFSIVLDSRGYLAAVVLTVGSALLCGFIPARRAWSSSPLEIIKGAAETTRFRRFAVRDGLLSLQIAVCTLLVAASLVAVNGMTHALHGALGFQPEGATLVTLNLSETTAPPVAVREKALVDALSSMAGVSAVGATTGTLGAGGGSRDVLVFRSETVEFRSDQAALATRLYSITPGYLAAAGTRLQDGRDFSWQDRDTTPLVAIVNETFARKMWADAPAIGQRFVVSGHLREVVAVVEDGKYHDLMEAPQPAVFLPLSQAPRSEVVLVVRSPLGPNQMGPALQRTLSQLEPDVPMTVQSWTEALRGALFPARAATVALSVMGVLAAMLAVTGIFGLAAYSVSRRMKELGIRVALGAGKQQIIVAAVGRPAQLLGLGSAIGLLASISGVRLLSRIVYHPEPGNPAVLGGALLIMVIIGITATMMPIRRALAINPSNLMREE
jgi:predicted permease